MERRFERLHPPSDQWRKQRCYGQRRERCSIVHAGTIACASLRAGEGAIKNSGENGNAGTLNVHRMFTLARDNQGMTSVRAFVTRPQSIRRYGKDKRGAVRYDVAKRLEYRIMDGESAFSWKQGAVHNMSATGVLIELAESLPVGCILEVAMDWPGLYHGKAAVRLVLCGSVVRTHGRTVAMRILSHQFRDVQRVAVVRGRPERNMAVA